MDGHTYHTHIIHDFCGPGTPLLTCVHYNAHRSNNDGGVTGIESHDLKLCVICLENARDVRFNCGHAVVCKKCLDIMLRPSATTPRCPTCRSLLGNPSGMSFGKDIARLETFLETEEENLDEEEGLQEIPRQVSSSYESVTASEVPQCFSHFTHTFTDGRDLVCDLQGVWNDTDGFIFTDPVIHHKSHKSNRKHGHNGRTDKGLAGIRKFFETHTCNSLCRRLGLKIPSF